jgi:hypothetical protein
MLRAGLPTRCSSNEVLFQRGALPTSALPTSALPACCSTLIIMDGVDRGVQPGLCATAPFQNPDLVVVSERLAVGTKKMAKRDEAN